ncbi:hypothetical protein CkP1_0061 [Citrobacter phage CkP1]|nr:hypothetical protein CkP1_0061 [Citrobacter phage CkP1]
MTQITLDDIHYSSMRVNGLGTFTVDKWMGITFDDSSESGYNLECVWHAHVSNLNENGYIELWKSWLKFCKENSFEPELNFVTFRKLMIKCFKLYEILK